jgi:hypothetical protein
VVVAARRLARPAKGDSPVTVAPFNPTPAGMVALLAMFSITAVALAAGLALRRFLSRWLPADDPRRQLIAQVLLYGGTFIGIAVSVWLRHR